MHPDIFEYFLFATFSVWICYIVHYVKHLELPLWFKRAIRINLPCLILQKQLQLGCCMGNSFVSESNISNVSSGLQSVPGFMREGQITGSAVLYIENRAYRTYLTTSWQVLVHSPCCIYDSTMLYLPVKVIAFPSPLSPLLSVYSVLQRSFLSFCTASCLCVYF